MAVDLINIEPTKIATDLIGRYVLLYGEQKSGKAQPVDTMIPTPLGDRRLGDLKIGDYVFDLYGRPTRVLEIYDQGMIDNYKVTFDDGSYTFCNHQHLWYCYDRKWRPNKDPHKQQKARGYEVVELQDMIDSNLFSSIYEEDHSTYKIPIGVDITGVSYYNNKKLKSPFKMGYCLNHDLLYPDFDKGFELLFPEYDFSLTDEIPLEYIETCFHQRISLLSGLISDRFTYSDDDQILSFSVQNRKMVPSMRKLISSLGYKNYVSDHLNIIKINIMTDFWLLTNLHLDEELIIKNKDLHSRKDGARYLSVVSIEKMPKQARMKCIYVDNKEHLYLTNNFITTHNTSFAVQAPKNLLIGFEIGWNALSGVKAIPCQNWRKFKEILRELRKPEVQALYSTISIDTVTLAYSCCEEWVCQQNGISEISELPYGGGYKLLKKEFREVFREITMLGYGIIFLAHTKQIPSGMTDKEGNEIKTVAPDLNDSSYQIINSIVDITAYIQVKKFEDGTSERTLYTRGTPTVFAGTRYKFLAPKIPFSYDNLVSAINEAVQKDLDNGAQAGEGGQHSYEADTHSDFEDLFNEARTVWKKNLEKDEGNKEVMTAIVQKILGEGRRISTVTEEEVEALKEIVKELYKI